MTTKHSAAALAAFAAFSFTAGCSTSPEPQAAGPTAQPPSVKKEEGAATGLQYGKGYVASFTEPAGPAKGGDPESFDEVDRKAKYVISKGAADFYVQLRPNEAVVMKASGISVLQAKVNSRIADVVGAKGGPNKGGSDAKGKLGSWTSVVAYPGDWYRILEGGPAKVSADGRTVEVSWAPCTAGRPCTSFGYSDVPDTLEVSADGRTLKNMAGQEFRLE